MIVSVLHFDNILYILYLNLSRHRWAQWDVITFSPDRDNICLTCTYMWMSTGHCCLLFLSIYYTKGLLITHLTAQTSFVGIYKENFLEGVGHIILYVEHKKKHSPSTIKCEIASVYPCLFLSLILIAPVFFLWHLVRSKRLWPADVSIFVLLSSWSSSPSLYHWLLMGSWPRKCILKMALCPALTVTGSVKELRSSGSNLGGSKKPTSWDHFNAEMVFSCNLIKC